MAENSGKGFSVPKMPWYWEEFWLSIIFLLLFPFLPLLAELVLAQKISASAVQISAGAYAVGLAVSSEYRLFFGVGLLFALGFAVSYGHSMTLDSFGASQFDPTTTAGLITVGIVGILSILHAAERYDRHVFRRNKFLEFTSPGPDRTGGD